MRLATTLFATLQTFSLLATAHPFIIISTRVTEIHVQHAIPTEAPRLQVRQNFYDDLTGAVRSALRLDDDDDDDDKTTKSSDKKKTSTSSSAAKTMVAPVTASVTASSQNSKSTSSDPNDHMGPASSNTEDEDKTSTENSATSTSTSTDSTTTSESISTSTSVTSISSATASPVATSTVASPRPTTTAESSNSDGNGNSVPPGGVAVGVIMSLLITALVAWLVFKYHPKSQAWWAARKQKKFQERSFREAIDGPGSPSLREQALGSSAAATRRQTLKSFFVPATARVGDGQEIRRKPVNWGVESPPLPQSTDNEKVSMTSSAAPMGQIERFSVVPQAASQQQLKSTDTVLSPVSPEIRRSEESFERLPPISPLSRLPSASGVQAERGLPPLALSPVPAIPGLVHAKRGSDGVFRLA